ncbi:MAG: CrcB family protein [Bacteroidetes bacterium]|nr:CrcB family protein [Bacteroidota bacterium]
MLFVFLGGGVGSVIRYIVSTFFVVSSNAFPFATFIVNIMGSFIIGLLMGYFIQDTAEQQTWKIAFNDRLLWRIYHLFSV